MNWDLSLADDDREALFAEMRAIGEVADHVRRTAARMAPPYGTVGLGSADFDYLLEAEVLDEFLRSLRSGSDPEQAHRCAVAMGELVVQRWNLHGSKARATFGHRANLHRDQAAGTRHADRALARVRAAVPKRDE
jgi:hypothetical protein